MPEEQITAHAYYSSDRCRKMWCYLYLTKSGIRVLLPPVHHCSTFMSLVLGGGKTSNGFAGGGCAPFPTLHNFSLIFMCEPLFMVGKFAVSRARRRYKETGQCTGRGGLRQQDCHLLLEGGRGGRGTAWALKNDLQRTPRVHGSARETVSMRAAWGCDIHKGAPCSQPGKVKPYWYLPDKTRVEWTAADWADVVDVSFWSHCGEHSVPLWLWGVWGDTSRPLHLTRFTLTDARFPAGPQTPYYCIESEIGNVTHMYIWRNHKYLTIIHDHT